jgi:hypothetical protein
VLQALKNATDGANVMMSAVDDRRIGRLATHCDQGHA